MMLTHNQRKLLTYLNQYVRENEGVSPSFDEMCKAMGLRSKSGIHKILDGLEDRGFISRVKGLPRAIEVLRCPGEDAKLSFSAIWHEHEEWSFENFGGPEVKGPLGPIKHLGREQKELLENPDDPSEYADCMFLIMDAARRQGLGLQGLLKAMADKQKILWTRDYRADASNPDEPVEHNRVSHKTREIG